MMIQILIVEDDWAAREGLQFLFSDEPDFEVVGVAKDGRVALTLLVAKPPDVVVLDVNLPGGISGQVITAEIQARGWPTRVLAYSAYADYESIEGMVEAGALGYYVKGGGNSQADMVRAVRMVSAGEFWMGKGLEEWMATKLRLERASEEGVKKLSIREVEVLELVEKGMSNKEIASLLGLELKTVKAHLEHIFKKLKVNNRMLACRVAREQGWL